MKKTKLLTCLVSLTALTTLVGCNETSYKEGVAISFTDANGKVTNYTTKELFEDYQASSSTASSDFDKIKEILIRKYYQDPSRAGDLSLLKSSAQTKVDGIKNQAETNAKNNGTSYATELEALLDGENVDNVEELYQKKLYEVESDKFNTDYQSDTNLVKMRDGKDADGNKFFPEDENFGKGSEGYLKTRMPYNVSHILLEASSASESDATSTAVSETEAKTFGDVILMMAGASTVDSDNGKKSVADGRMTFGELAKTYSKDTGSAEKYGNLGIMDTSTSFVQGFQYGVYAYDLFFNKSTHKDADAKKSAIMYSEDAKFRNEKGEETLLSGATAAHGVLGEIGTIPFGAAVALANDQVNKNFPSQQYQVNDNDSAYMPRNVIWNKYFNSHRIAVITPNRIAYNDVVEAGFTQASEEAAATKYAEAEGYYKKAAEDAAWKGTLDNDYAKLPGFQNNTKDILDVKDASGNAENVLTNEKGQIILAVRGDSGTKGIHFIVVERSPLIAYAGFDNGKYVETTESSSSKDITSLSEYYTFENPAESKSYPQYTHGDTKVNKTTLITMGLDTTKENYKTNIEDLKSKVKAAYSSDLDTYEVQYLVKETNAQFNVENATVKTIMDSVYNYSKQQRKKNAEDAEKSIDEAWAKYAEFLLREDASRETRADGSQKLISEVAALTYNTADARDGKNIWGIVTSGTHAGKPGACYKK